MRVFFDANILLYSISSDTAEALKKERAIALLEKEGALSVQVLQEFYVQATRPSRCDPIPHEVAAGLVRTWTRFPVQDMTVAILMHALHITARYRLSYWDSAIVAAAHALGCERLYSEDMSHGQKIVEVEIFNPFLELAQSTGPN